MNDRIKISRNKQFDDYDLFINGERYVTFNTLTNAIDFAAERLGLDWTDEALPDQLVNYDVEFDIE